VIDCSTQAAQSSGHRQIDLRSRRR
jgi:hypothetical protein